MVTEFGILSQPKSIDGFLSHRSEWNENVATQIAEKEGLTLTKKHWDIIHFVRSEFYVNGGTVPLESEIRRGMEREWHTQLSTTDIAFLFPQGSQTQAAKIAGCITVSTVSDLLKVKGDAVWSVNPKQPVTDALRILSDKNIGALMVVEHDRLVGIVSERDFTRHVVLQDRAISDTRVVDIMSMDVVHVEPGDSLEHCMELMSDRGFRHLPVLDHDRLAGVLSMPDLVRVIVDQQRFTISQLKIQKSQIHGE